MKSYLNVGLAAVLLLASVGAAAAESFTKGTVRKVDAQGGKVTVAHEELVGLEMPAMTMVFRAADEAMLASLSEGQEIEFVADRVKGKLTIVQLK